MYEDEEGFVISDMDSVPDYDLDGYDDSCCNTEVYLED